MLSRRINGGKPARIILFSPHPEALKKADRKFPEIGPTAKINWQHLVMTAKPEMTRRKRVKKEVKIRQNNAQLNALCNEATQAAKAHQ